ncbi:hypothetical protein [Pseudochryseolinea flava]|uniref:Peptidase MA-like domain-containing protein n=1 Tax=Pseudochryseolinea flava TaxID=2059302 RepID=A0A364XUR9_9BACT|nr:hypothetical protein [Pseudochryseolinea flava]RAV97873.1 hypothetical protein DQQ10_26315 [Pseudochryseolinea flava]
MRKIKIVLSVLWGCLAVYLGARIYRSLFVTDDLHELRSDHFVVTYHGIYTNEASELLNHLEHHYDRIRKKLNDPAHEIIHVFIHPTQSDFSTATGLRHSSVTGTSRGPNAFHVLWTTWFNSVLPDDPLKTAVHEFTHCVQLNILIQQEQKQSTLQALADFDKVFEEKFSKEYPQWFWESICDYEAGIVNCISVKYGMRGNPTLKSLKDGNQIYNVGYTLIEYIVDRWGADKLPLMITSYADIEKVLQVSESEFESGWIEFVNERY